MTNTARTATKTALITGCSDDGIGSGLAQALQARNIHVFATARTPAKMSQLASLDNVTLLQLDVTNAADIAAAVQTVTAATGGTLDYLINNAGRNHFMPILDEDVDTLKALWEVNVWGPLAVTQAFAPLVVRRKGMMVFVTSTAGHLNVPYMGSYSGSKRTLELMAEALRLEVAPFGVDVLSIVTGAVVSQGQTYFEDFALPKDSVYRKIEDTIASRARGGDGVLRMSLTEYAEQVAEAIVSRKTGRIWAGARADATRAATTGTVPQETMDALTAAGTGLDQLQGS